MLDAKTQQPILPIPRVMQQLDVDSDVDDEERFPLPPAGGPDGLPGGLTQDDLPNALQNLVNRTSGPGDVERFGRYLFSSLLGPELWARIDSAAGWQPIELALTWAADDRELSRLPWESMHTAKADSAHIYEGFLAADPDVSITRRVADTNRPTYRIEFLPTPPRVLFVIGSSLTDPVIRSGAEYLGLLKNLEKSNRYLYSHLLANATTDSLSEAIKNFRPTIVHIICHGVIPDSGKPSLEFRSSGGSGTPDYVDAERLQLVLKHDQDVALPRIVVLNACSTATAADLKVGRPLAAELVELGVPIVVGMSGKVADQACRLFSRGFYQALLDGGDIARAAARGRRAAIAHSGYDPRNQIDWALPTMFLAEGVGEAHLNIRVDDDEVERLRQAMEFSKRPDYPVFCGRWEFFQLYRDLMSGGQHQFLAISSPRPDATNSAELLPQYGSTRLLKELAAQAMRDGHIPILISKDWIEQKRWPSRLVNFLDVIYKAVNQTIQVFGGIARHETLLYRAWDWKYLPAFKDSYPGSPPMNDLPEEFRQTGLSADQRLAKAFMLDLLEFRRTICAQRGQDEQADVKLLLLIEDYHQLVFGDSLSTLLRSYGLRDPRARAKTRCVITYNEDHVDSQGGTVSGIKDWANSREVLTVPLTALHDYIDPVRPLANPESFQQAVLVYKHFLLHWRPRDQKSPLSIALNDDTPAVRSFIAGLAYESGGLPSGLCGGRFTGLIHFKAFMEAEEDRFLRKADDEDTLADLDVILRKRGPRP